MNPHGEAEREGEVPALVDIPGDCAIPVKVTVIGGGDKARPVGDRVLNLEEIPGRDIARRPGNGVLNLFSGAYGVTHVLHDEREDRWRSTDGVQRLLGLAAADG